MPFFPPPPPPPPRPPFLRPGINNKVMFCKEVNYKCQEDGFIIYLQGPLDNEPCFQDFSSQIFAHPVDEQERFPLQTCPTHAHHTFRIDPLDSRVRVLDDFLSPYRRTNREERIKRERYPSAPTHHRSLFGLMVPPPPLYTFHVRRMWAARRVPPRRRGRVQPLSFAPVPVP
ncbi:unnamed protein product [Nesidiocoris tenuis]|uniref:Uncharacterized protein n=1 Tax=Nesidiocoris tenuis TaxID=355587 RepID=A0A6H5GV40_9HEMI|nr:unnamed protein product [Nesidiocoris tenuis]